MSAAADRPSMSWIGIIRLGLVQTALGAIVVLTTSTLNRVMVVELALPAILPGALVGLHYAIQVLRPRWGHGSDVGGRRTPWIIGGMAVLATGGVMAAFATALMSDSTALGTALAVLAFLVIGVGVGASGTALLTLLAVQVKASRRAPAATIVWLMMIAGFAITAGVAGSFLDPFTMDRLILVTSAVSALAFAITVAAIWRVENPAFNQTALAAAPGADSGTKAPFTQALKQVWGEAEARQFTIFVFVSMLAYSTQDLILEPFAGVVFGMTPGETTKLAGIQHGGVFTGMVLVAVIAGVFAKSRQRVLRLWTVGGCLGSAGAFAMLALGGLAGETWPLKANVFALGLANGAFAAAAISSMMNLAGRGRASREGVRMGLWGAAQGTAFGIGGFIGTAAVDINRLLFAADNHAYATVFALEGCLFMLSAYLAARIGSKAATGSQQSVMPSTLHTAPHPGAGE